MSTKRILSEFIFCIWLKKLCLWQEGHPQDKLVLMPFINTILGSDIKCRGKVTEMLKYIIIHFSSF